MDICRPACGCRYCSCCWRSWLTRAAATCCNRHEPAAGDVASGNICWRAGVCSCCGCCGRSLPAWHSCTAGNGCTKAWGRALSCSTASTRGRVSLDHILMPNDGSVHQASCLDLDSSAETPSQQAIWLRRQRAVSLQVAVRRSGCRRGWQIWPSRWTRQTRRCLVAPRWRPSGSATRSTPTTPCTCKMLACWPEKTPAVSDLGTTLHK